jgi:DNA helicase-2/ATP-dependent DNA helicase PcrA
VDYAYDQRPGAARPLFAPGERVRHATLGEGLVRACDGTGAEAKVTVAFFSAGERRVVARYLRPA